MSGRPAVSEYHYRRELRIDAASDLEDLLPNGHRRKDRATGSADSPPVVSVSLPQHVSHQVLDHNPPGK
jgi:hypothetical protein